MNTYLYLLTAYFLTGLFCITLIDTLGAVASRKFNFKYTYLSVLSFSVYIGIGYLLSSHFELIIILATNAFLGLYDSTIGLKLSTRLKANSENIDLIEGSTKMVISVITLAVFLGFIGYCIFGYFTPLL
ncbi:hypothetical protein DBR40_19240 [Pedobacter sp. KBW01]|nr:hypothetical protein DBR40_19240 [Pedobacter sp. KBW01]